MGNGIAKRDKAGFCKIIYAGTRKKSKTMRGRDTSSAADSSAWCVLNFFSFIYAGRSHEKMFPRRFN